MQNSDDRGRVFALNRGVNGRGEPVGPGGSNSIRSTAGTAKHGLKHRLQHDYFLEK